MSEVANLTQRNGEKPRTLIIPSDHDARVDRADWMLKSLLAISHFPFASGLAYQKGSTGGRVSSIHYLLPTVASFIKPLLPLNHRTGFALLLLNRVTACLSTYILSIFLISKLIVAPRSTSLHRIDARSNHRTQRSQTQHGLDAIFLPRDRPDKPIR